MRAFSSVYNRIRSCYNTAQGHHHISPPRLLRHRLSSSSSSSPHSAAAGFHDSDDHPRCSGHVSEEDEAGDKKKTIAEELLLRLDGPWNPSKEENLSAFLPISAATLQEVIKSLAQNRKEDCGLCFLSWAAQAQQPSVIGSEDMEVIGKTWAESYGAQKVSSMHHRILASWQNAPEPAWAALMVSYTKLGRPAQAVSLFMDMKKAGRCKPTLLSYEALLFALVKCNRSDAALVIAREMLSDHLLPGHKPLGTLLDALCKTGKAEAALALVQEIEKLGRGSAPDFLRQAYSRFITAVWRTRYNYMALEILREMKTKDLKPDKHAYTACVKLLCRNHRFDMAQELVKEMEKENCDLDLPMYVALIQGLNRGGKVKEALSLAEILMKKKNGLSLDTRIYTAILSSFFLAGKVSDAIHTFERLQTEEGHVADAMMYVLMIKNLCKAGHIRRALDIKEEMIRKGFEPDARFYLALSHGLCMGSAHIEELLHVVEEMRSKMYLPPAEVYLTLVTHFCTLGRLDEAQIWAKEMRSHGHEPTPYLRTTFFSKLDDVSVR